MTALTKPLKHDSGLPAQIITLVFGLFVIAVPYLWIVAAER